MKNLSFGKIAALAGGFFVVLMVGTLVFLKMQAANKGTFVKTKAYQNQEAQQGAPAQQAALQVPTQAQAAIAPAQATQQQGMQNTVSAAAVLQTTPTAGPAPTAAAPNQSTPQVASGDVGSQLASIDAKLTRFDARISALETRLPGAAGSAKGREKNASAPRVAPSRRVATRTPSANKLKEVAKTDPAPREAQGYKSMAVVGNRAWVSLPDGSEANVTAGDVVPQPRPRVRAIDPNSGVIIMSSDERIGTH